MYSALISDKSLTSTLPFISLFFTEILLSTKLILTALFTVCYTAMIFFHYFCAMLQVEFEKNIEKLGVSKHNDKILLAISGGIDSVVMANLFFAAKFNVAIAHCNFSLRGKASDDDADFVEAFAKSHEIMFHSIKFDTENYAHRQKISIEMAARELRYEWFENICKQYNYSKTAIAHNKNDAVETFFLNLVRGTGIKGLLGITAKTETIIRPLLFASRKQIENHANKHNIAFCTDETNSSNKFVRNRIRNNIISEFEIINPVFLQTMTENINHLSQCYDALQSLKCKIIADVSYTDNDIFFIDTDKLHQTGNEQLWLFEILQQFNFKTERIADIYAALDGESGKKFFSPTHVLLKDRKKLIISVLKSDEYLCVEIDENTEKIDCPVSLKIEKKENKNIVIEKKRNIAFLNFDKLKFPLILRRWQAGESFTPFGMKGRKKLSDYFIDKKLSQFEKDEQYVLESDKKIVWLVNHRIDDNFKIDENCKTVLKITYEHAEKKD
ncbi:MAG: tRNA lysidine(34) synthetase TilS [Prevotellaceae bacterium]|jgi:tRNA(Ile)-lysidine synthase|nr:tRNA lysidine(34) synthetase TilS [Prevotellaceae bacterium]